MISVALTWLGVALGTAVLLLMALSSIIDSVADGWSSVRVRRRLKT